jgi:glutamate synthase domain-containing protein 2/FAD/FMN-containing dehydrogenase/glutamate synthase domain-containing protein 3/ferredoxin
MEVNQKKEKLTWRKYIGDFLQRTSGLKAIDDPEKLEYYRTDLNVDLPPLIRDLMLKSLPELILQPGTEEHLKKIFSFASEHKIPLTVRGAGTWGYGGAVPTRGGILIDLGFMDSIEVDPEKLHVTVGPGARFLDIQKKLEPHGLDLSTIASGKGGTLIGWIATGGMGIGTFRHGPVRNQIVSLRVITPDGTVKDLSEDDPEMNYFISTEGQMGIIIRATLRVCKRPFRWIPVVLSFETSAAAYDFAKEVASHPSIKPEDIIVYHPHFISTLDLPSVSKLSSEHRHLVLISFPEEKEAQNLKVYLAGRQLVPVDEALANALWEKRFLPMSIKSLGPSLLASEIILPVEQVAPYVEKLNEMGKRLAVTLYPIGHLVNPKEALFLAMLATDNRKNIFYLDLMFIPMMLKLAVQSYGGKPYGIGIWNTPFLRHLYAREELRRLRQYKKKADPAGILNSGKFFATSGRWGSFQRTLFQADFFDLGLTASQWLMFRLLSFFPAEKLRLRTPIVSEKLDGMAKEILSCAQCGACVGNCPVYRATGDETLTARGKFLTIKKALEKGELELSKALPLYLCLRCGRCDEECQVHLKHLPLFEGLEKYLADTGDFPVEQIREFIREVENSPDFHRFLDIMRTGFDQKIHEKRNTFPRYRVLIDEAHCIHCGTCVDACIYSVRKRGEADPRLILIEDEGLCRGCGSCLERCPQLAAGLPATTVELHPCYLQIDDPYWTAQAVTRIDLEATTGKIPVSGTGQGDPHRGSGNDGIRFGHFHIVGPAQNLLYESTEDAIAIHLGRRPKYLKFDGGKIDTPASPLITLKTPILLDLLPVDVGEDWLTAMLEASVTLGTRMTIRIEDFERFRPKIENRTDSLILRFSPEDLKKRSGRLKDLPVNLIEIEVDETVLKQGIDFRDLFSESAVLSAVIKIEKEDITSELQPSLSLQAKLDALIRSPFDLLCLTSDYTPEKGYYPTTDGVPAVHRYLVEKKIRHRFSIVGAGGIRSAADAQKTVQRGANGIKIDWPILIIGDPQARQKFLKGESVQSLQDSPLLAKRIVNLIRVWNIQIIEVLGASGFKDIKKTVGEENRLVIFDDLEERVYDIFYDPLRLKRNEQANRDRMKREGPMAGHGWRYRQLREMIHPTDPPHRFYAAKMPPACQRIFDQDHVWPASLISSVGRMAAGDQETLLLKNTESTGNLRDGFDVIGIRFSRNPDEIEEERLDEVSAALQLTPSLRLKTPLVGAGMSVGSIGPGTWRARVLATRALKTQLDTGEGGYPTFYILDSKWNPLDLSERQVILIGRVMDERRLITVEELIRRTQKKETMFPEYQEIGNILKRYPSSMPVQFVPIVTSEEEPYVSTQLKTGLFGVTKETIRRARRVVITYSQGAKQGVGGHLLGRKVFGLVSRLRGVPEGVSLISPFPFHNCYSIEDVKAFIDAVRMINRQASICIKVAPSPDIEFIVSGLARIAKDNQMTIEIWLDGPRGGTGAAPDIIKGQMGMHMEYAIPICHEKLMDSDLRDYVVFMGSGGMRTWADIIKGIALGLDGVVLGTADLVAIGCVRDRNCESGCRSGISTVNPKMQLLRNVELNTQQIINFRAILQAQIIRAIAALGMKDIRQLRGRYDCIRWSLLEERVESHRKSRKALAEADVSPRPEIRGLHPLSPLRVESHPPPSDCGVAAIVSNYFIPSHVMDLMLDRMANRGMDGVGIWKGGCYPHRLDHYALHVLIKGVSQEEVELQHLTRNLGLHFGKIRQRAREEVLALRLKIIQEVFDKYFKGLEVAGDDTDLENCRIPYRLDPEGREEHFRLFGEKDPGDIYRFFVRVRREELHRFIERELLTDEIWPPLKIRYPHLGLKNYSQNEEFLREAEDEYIYRLSRRITEENYVGHPQKKAAVLSCGKNSGCWKSDGRHIPWELPDAPVNIIHRRLATGSVVDQMNSHPFSELHTALTHNGETTNYRTMLNRVNQFNLTPLAQTDTAVASLKLHLLSQYLRYPFDALVESFSPTTGWNLAQLPSEVRERFERIQEVELESAPDGPYQYLCGRIDPDSRSIERLDIIDPSLLRPNVAMLYDDGKNFVSIICSEKQGCDAGLQELYRLGLIKSPMAPLTFTVNPGMVSRVFYDGQGKITGHEVLDKFGKRLDIPHGNFPSLRDADGETQHVMLNSFQHLKNSMDCETLKQVQGDKENYFQSKDLLNFPNFIRERLPQWGFGEFKTALEDIPEKLSPLPAVEELARIYDRLSGWETGQKDRGALLHMVKEQINQVLDRQGGQDGLFRATVANAGKLEKPKRKEEVLVVDARGFLAEGVDPLKVLSPFLDHAHRMGWRRFIVYRTEGQRGIGMGMGSGDTSDTTVDVFGSPGEYCGAFNMGALIRVHGHAQNFTGMVMHSGILDIHGDAGKVTGYSAKGGTFNILGNIVDRGWVCAVSDPRGPGLQVNIVGTGYEHLCQALMGGSVMMLGLYRGKDGILHRMESPYRGAKILAGASAGEVIFYDPKEKVSDAQYRSCVAKPIDHQKWEGIMNRLMSLEKVFGLGFSRENSHLTIHIEKELQIMRPEDFKWIVPKGELAGYH